MTQHQSKVAARRTRAAPPKIVGGMPQRLRSSRPDLDARVFLRWYHMLPQPSYARYSMRQRRLAMRLLALALGQHPPVSSVRDVTIAGPGGPIPLRIYAGGAPGASRPAFLWCHGGAFQVGGLDTADSICRAIARAADCIVVAVSYRLAPENDLKAGREDALAVLEWMAGAEGASCGIDGQRLAIGGDSAGGNISAAVAQRATRERGLALRLQVLVYSATDLEREFASKAENARKAFLTAKVIDQIRRELFTPDVDLKDPWLSPSLSPDLRGLPPALMITAGYDPIRDDGLDYAARLRAAGVPVELLHYAGQFHGFLNFDAVIGAARDALQRMADALTQAFDGADAPDRTLEIADARAEHGRRSLAVPSLGELAAGTVAFWAAVQGWGGTLLGLAPLEAARRARRLLGAGLYPASWVRQRIADRLSRPAVIQTYPSDLNRS